LFLESITRAGPSKVKPLGPGSTDSIAIFRIKMQGTYTCGQICNGKKGEERTEIKVVKVKQRNLKSSPSKWE